MLTKLDNLGVLTINGQDAASFLQGQITCDINEVTPTHASFAAYCTYQGRVIATFHIMYFDESYLMIMPTTMIDLMITKLNKYAAFSKVELTNDSKNYQILGYINQNKPLDNFPTTVNEVTTLQHCSIIQIPGSMPRFYIIGQIQHIKQLTANLFTDESNGNITTWHQQDIEANLPILYPETSELFTPHMLNLPKLNAVSFTKGCYLGQEIIARTEYRGSVKRTLQTVELNTTASPTLGKQIIDFVRLENDKFLTLQIKVK